MEHWKKNVAYALALCCLLLSTCQMVQHAKKTNELGYTFIVGEDGTYIYGKLRGLNPESEVYRRFLKHVARLRFQLTPEGLADPEGAAAVFTGKAAKASLAMDVKRWEARGAKENNLFGTPFLQKIERFKPNGRNPIFRISGYVLVTGVIGGMNIREEEPFFMSLELARNPKLNIEPMVDTPFVVVSYKATMSRRNEPR